MARPRKCPRPAGGDCQPRPLPRAPAVSGYSCATAPGQRSPLPPGWRTRIGHCRPSRQRGCRCCRYGFSCRRFHRTAGRLLLNSYQKPLFQVHLFWSGKSRARCSSTYGPDRLPGWNRSGCRTGPGRCSTCPIGHPCKLSNHGPGYRPKRRHACLHKTKRHGNCLKTVPLKISLRSPAPWQPFRFRSRPTNSLAGPRKRGDAVVRQAMRHWVYRLKAPCCRQNNPAPYVPIHKRPE